MIRSVLVLGGGSAGYLAALALKKKLPELTVTVIRSKEIGVIGVGEATTVALPKFLHGYLEFDPGEFYRRVETTWKLGIRFLWGPRTHFDYTFGYQMDWKWSALSRCNGYYCRDDFSYVDVLSGLMSHDKGFVRRPDGGPHVTINHAYHIENEKFVAWLESKAEELGIVSHDEKVTEVLRDENGIAGLRIGEGVIRRADLYLDCSGFRSALLGSALQEPYESFKSTLFNNRAVTGGWRRTTETTKPYTTAETMDAGWCWQIDHLDRINRGYVYSTDFISDEMAEREFRAKNPKVDSTRLVKFVTGKHQRSWVKNVVAIGNSAGFVEPLESTGLAVICDESRLLAECLSECDRRPTPSLIDAYNRIYVREWDNIRWFLGIHFKFNTRIDNEYWRACRESANIGDAQTVVDYYRENGPSLYAKTNLLHNNDIFGMEGFLSLLVGQNLPYRCDWKPSPQEWKIWHGIRAENRIKAITALSVEESYRAVASPNFVWDMSMYK